MISRVSSLSMESFLKKLELAVADGYSVKILYYKSGEKQLNDRLVDPYRIVYWNNKWYLIGFCHLRNAIRSLRIDRIENLLLTENKFNPPENFSARDFFIENLLPTIEDKEEAISLVIHGDKNVLADVCQHWFLGHYLQKRTSNQAVFLLEKNIIHTYVPYLLLPYNQSIKVIEPVSLKKRLIEVLSEFTNFHQEG